MEWMLHRIKANKIVEKIFKKNLPKTITQKIYSE